MGGRSSLPVDRAIPKVVDRFFEFSLLGMLGAGYCALAGSGYLDWPTATLTLLALCLRGLMAAGIIEIQIPNRVAAIVVLLAVGFFPLDSWLVSGSPFGATVHLICVLATVKLLTAKTTLDFAFLRMVAVIELLTAAVLSVSAGFFVFLALFALFAIAGFSSGEVRQSARVRLAVVRSGLRSFPRRLVLISMFLFSGIFAMTAVLFFVLPRTARAAFERLMPARYHVSGFSNGVTLGQIGEIKKNSAPVMHVRSWNDGGFLQVRWRGAVLTNFDGRRWTAPPGHNQTLQVDRGELRINAGRPQMRPGHEISYTVRLDDAASDTLFIAGTPLRLRIDVPILEYTPSQSFNIVAPSNVSGITYGVFSYLEDEGADALRTPRPLSLAARERLLDLPPIDSRIPKLARAMAAGAETDAEKAEAIENHLRRDYGYTLELLPSAVPDPLATFLFERKKGHCEYFATAMAVMLRTLGIPSRMVTGFQSGVYNPITKLQVVRASDAHSWVEAWITGRGWTTYDPTPFDPGPSGSGWMSRVSLFFDAVEQFWQDWVVSYDFDRQTTLASHMDESARRLEVRMQFAWMTRLVDWIETAALRAKAAVLLAVVAAAALLAFCVPMLLRWSRGRIRFRRLARGQGRASDATVLYQRMLRALARRNLHKPAWMTPLEFARVLPASEVSLVVDNLTVFYNELRYGGRAEIAPHMMRLIERLEKM